MNLVDNLKRAFGERSEPPELWSPECVPEDIEEVASFAGLEHVAG